MKTLIVLLFIIFTSTTAFSQSSWEVNGQDLTINYTTLGKNTARGAWYGTMGYAAGMWISDNRTEWGVVGAMVTAIAPVVIDGAFKKEPEAVVGRFLGAATVSLAITFTIGKVKKDQPIWRIAPKLRRGR